LIQRGFRQSKHNSEYNYVPDVWSKLLLFIIEWDCRYSLVFKFDVNDGLTVSVEWNGLWGENECIGFVRNSTLGEANAIVAWVADA